MARQRASGLSQHEFCRREGLNPNTFSSWKEVIRQRDGDGTGIKAELQSESKPSNGSENVAFVPVAVAAREKEQPIARAVVAELHPSGIVCILSGADVDTLRSLLTALRECKR